MKKSKYTYAGRSCFELPTGRYYVVSRHRTKGAAKAAQGRLDYPKGTLVRAYGKSWLLLAVQTAK